MKAVRFHETGGPDVLQYEDVPDPVPGPGQVLIKVEAVGMNFADVMRRRGDPYPEASRCPSRSALRPQEPSLLSAKA